jgi:hypothetical protein
MNNKEQKADLLPSASIAQSNMLAEGVFVGKRKAKQLTRKITDVFFEEIHKLTDNELRAVIKRCEGFSQTNCGWSEYWMKDIIVKVAKDHLRYKKEERKRNKKRPVSFS